MFFMRITAAAETEFLEEVFQKAGFYATDGTLLADTLVDADLRGISSHGIQRLDWYIRMVKAGTIKPQNEVKTLKETDTSLLLDANGNMGQIASALAIKSLIKKAKTTNIAMAVIRNSNHFGTAGYYSRLAAEAGLIGISTTNTRPLVVPTNAIEAFLGSNAFAFTFPADPHPFVFDGATSSVSSGKIMVLAKNQKPILGEWAIDRERNIIHDSKKAAEILSEVAFTEHQSGGGVLTLGGNREENSNYKGFGNSLVVELLTGILAQGSISADTNTGKHDFSQFFMVINPAFFGDLATLKANAEKMFERIRNLDHIPGTHIMIPGDREYRNYDHNSKHGVVIDPKTIQEITAIAEKFAIKLPQEIKE